jgi:hypothetical protein
MKYEIKELTIMSLINFSDIDFTSTDMKPHTFTFNGNEIQVLKYLPFKDKYDLIMITLQKSFKDNIYNECSLRMYFDLYLVLLYTNILPLPKADEVDEIDMYDKMKYSGLIDTVKSYINVQEIDDLWACIRVIAAEDMKYRHSAIGFIEDFVDDLGGKVEKALVLLKDMNIQEEIKKISAATFVDNGAESN